MKTLLVLGGARAQLKLINTAKEMGLRTVVVGIPGNYPGYELADVYIPVDIYNKEGVLKVAKQYSINGISMVCSDFGLSTVGYVCDEMGLSGLSEYAADASSNKLKMKQLFEQENVRTAKFRMIRNDCDVNDAVQVLSFPLIVKSVDLQGSRGIYICHDIQSLLDCYKLSIEESRVDYCIVEEFIEGEEFGAQAFVYNGEVIFVLPHGDKTMKINSTQVPLIHYTPYKENNKELLCEIGDLCRRAIKALTIDNSAVNIDLIIKDNIPYIIEVAARAGANCLPELVGTKLGLNYYKMVILGAIGENPKTYYESAHPFIGSVMTKMIFSQKGGVVTSIESCPSNITLFVKEGDEIRSFTNSRDYIGETISIGDSLNECEQKIKMWENNLQLSIK